MHGSTGPKFLGHLLRTEPKFLGHLLESSKTLRNWLLWHNHLTWFVQNHKIMRWVPQSTFIDDICHSFFCISLFHGTIPPFRLTGQSCFSVLILAFIMDRFCTFRTGPDLFHIHKSGSYNNVGLGIIICIMWHSLIVGNIGPSKG